MGKRIDWLDAGKGLGMLLVMLGHADIPEPLKTYIYTFHMPLFFFLSGYLFQLNKFPSLRVFLTKRTRSLVLPYLCFSFVAYIWFIILFEFNQVDYNHNLFLPLIGSLIATRRSLWTVHVGALWFVNCLLCTELLFYFIAKLGRKKVAMGITLILISVCGCLYNKVVGKPLPWSIDTAMISVGFYGAGFLFKEYQSKLQRFIQLKTAFLLLVVNFLAGYLNFVLSGDRVDLYESSLGNIPLFYLSAFSGIGAFVILFKHVKRSKSLKYIGRNSFIYLALHQKIVFVLFNLLVQNSLLDSEKILHFPMVKGILFTLIAAVILVPAVYLINRYLPFMLGKTKKSHKRQLGMNVS